MREQAVVQWLRHCATNRKVAESIPDGVRIFHRHNPSGRPGVDSASNRNEYPEWFLGVKAAGAQGWQPCHLHVPIVMKSGSLNLLEPSGPVMGLLYYQQYALILFYVLAPTCFGSSLSSSGSCLDPSEFETQIVWVVYHIMCGYVACLPECCSSVCCAAQQGSTTDGTTTLRHTGHVPTHDLIYHPYDLYFK
jgi:hypothetical protein